MSTRLVNLVADAADPAASAHWWAEALGWAVIFETRHEVAVEPPAGRPGLPGVRPRPRPQVGPQPGPPRPGRSSPPPRAASSACCRPADRRRAVREAGRTAGSP